MSVIEKIFQVTDYDSFKKLAEEHAVVDVDLCFTDPRGKMQHTAQRIETMDADAFKDGINFDGSSIAGWKDISQSDMTLIPDLSSTVLDPFSAQPKLNVFCDVIDPTTGESYNRDPRGVAKRAEDYLKVSGIADMATFGPEPEFFIFEDARVITEPNQMSYRFDSEELPQNKGTAYEDGNLGHRQGHKGGYFPAAPVDSLADLRSEMLSVMKAMDVPVEKHHHEVAPAQCELGVRFAPPTKCADNMQIYKYVVQNVANAYGKSATFMPKPIFGDNGSGMHCHQSLWKGGKPLFAGDDYAGLSQEALWYIGGLLKHAKALNAFTNPSTNSYKRLVPGYEAPVLLAYSARNRSASCRIPFSPSPNGKRVELRFPDPMANPYLAFSAMLMAGLDGIKNKIDPGKPMDKNLYDLPEKELKRIPHVCRSLREALEALQKDHKFLLEGDVFSKDQIDGYIALKMEEVERFETAPHPVEVDMYYSA